ncbi:hypothetical protein K492DRAFT_171378 [Lichtheimia hyalospora FSU 10163]|nr:hypothetical protein K492DRAFT_171378 [Lichtheimia hyalospora FSU 10163]
MNLYKSCGAWMIVYKQVAMAYAAQVDVIPMVLFLMQETQEMMGILHLCTWITKIKKGSALCSCCQAMAFTILHRSLLSCP